MLQSQIDQAAGRSIAFLHSLAGVDGQPEGVMRISTELDLGRWPGMLLPGSYNGIMALDLLGGLADWPEDRRKALCHWFLRQRQSDGIFQIPGIDPSETFKKPDPVETKLYMDYHVTNYSLGAIEALCPDEVPVLDFLDEMLDPLRLKAWLSDRDLRDPWQEGNNIVNLASFLLLKLKHDPDARDAVEAAIKILFDWHERLQEPATGFWGVGQALGGTPLLHAMAGSMHNYHLWYALDRPLPYQHRAVDYVLGLKPDWHSACIDVDTVDLLIHAQQASGYRKDEVDQWLRLKLEAILEQQKPDGGFADTNHSIWRQDGWIGGYFDWPGVSTSFATWFRWIAIAMIDDHLWPGRRPWRFRSMIGIGYRKAPNNG
ncbi:hypothetical protein [uncultured Cohaesibacter sp.]|uniref:hypothetical protein n=1 Tax=uncultured Cohaesibacter sp. TaxID=1002546 RepID=UPI0029C95433|nr:hypothetical protein [uncultured Cohaesibacter sp.]